MGMKNIDTDASLGGDSGALCRVGASMAGACAAGVTVQGEQASHRTGSAHRQPFFSALQAVPDVGSDVSLPQHLVGAASTADQNGIHHAPLDSQPTACWHLASAIGAESILQTCADTTHNDGVDPYVDTLAVQRPGRAPWRSHTATGRAR